MTRKHATGVILLSGWLLVTPPADVDLDPDGKVTIYTQEPIKEWKQQSAHDTPSECERAKEKEQGRLMAMLNDQTIDGMTRKANGFLLLSIGSAKCVPAEVFYDLDAETKPAKRKKGS